MNKLFLAAMAFGSALPVLGAPLPALRPPAVPLVAHSPYFSCWSHYDKLTDGWPTHWTGAINAMCGLARVDGKAVRFMGAQPTGMPAIPAMDQTSLVITPTRTTYTFRSSGVELSLSFLSPVLADDLHTASLPVTHVELVTRSTDGASHEVSLYLDCTGEWAVHDASQQVGWSRARADGQPAVELLSIGTSDQPVLRRVGDHTRIDWGRFYIGTPATPGVSAVIGQHDVCRAGFARSGELPGGDDLDQPRSANDRWPVLAVRWSLGPVGATPLARRCVLAYDERLNVEYFGRKLRPYWNRDGIGFGRMLADEVAKADQTSAACAAFDQSLSQRLRAACGERLGAVCELVYRQVIAAHCIAADFNGTPLMFAKENTSNGCIGTVDVIFPTSPFFLALNPAMLEAQLLPVMEYCVSPRWKFPFAPHDLGTYPLANGQVYGGGEHTEENQMPVEETANMLLMLAALDKAGRPGLLAERYWPTLERWAGYLMTNGLDPANQLCTDDFAGHLARNANLAVKAILAIGAMEQVCRAHGHADKADRYKAAGAEMAGKWRTLAADGDTGHTVLAYGRAGTWSLKYNMVWDRVLNLGIFGPEVWNREAVFYRTKLAKFGMPMDNRAAYTKPEWEVWAACLASDRADFEAMVAPIYDCVNGTRDRVPMSDWFDTGDGHNMGMYARSVVGGMYMPLLLNK